MGIKIGLLPLYLKLYDDTSPSARDNVELFYRTITEAFIQREVKVVTSKICRVRDEFSEALDRFADSGVDAVVTIHLAYSPSLEVIEPLAASRLPIVILDTTPDFHFGPDQTMDRITFNHGIHGVQDLCSMLVRNQRQFFIEAGHWEHSDVIDRVLGHVRAAAAAHSLRNMKIGLIGEPFAGMGDFQVDFRVLRERIGVQVVPFGNRELCEADGQVLEKEARHVMGTGDLSEVPADILNANLRILHTIRSWMQEEGLSGFTCNFLQVTRDMPINRVPFLAASVAMYEGYGYAGEGDILTTALVSALLKLNMQTSFAEMFCPDWANNQIFLSHMGEVNPRVCRPVPRYAVKEYRYSDADEPVYAVGQFQSGTAVLVNLVPLADEKFRLVLAPVTAESYENSSFSGSVHGWIRPESGNIREFLECYSILGGTHHSALVYGEDIRVLRTFGEAAGWDVQVIE